MENDWNMFEMNAVHTDLFELWMYLSSKDE